MSEYRSEFGSGDHVYAADLFNEMRPETNDSGYIKVARVSRARLLLYLVSVR